MLKKYNYPALLLTMVNPFTLVSSNAVIRFSGIPHNPKPKQKTEFNQFCLKTSVSI